eukprot:1393831-Rhodomonas_salina.2
MERAKRAPLSGSNPSVKCDQGALVVDEKKEIVCNRCVLDSVRQSCCLRSVQGGFLVSSDYLSRPLVEQAAGAKADHTRPHCTVRCNTSVRRDRGRSASLS